MNFIKKIVFAVLLTSAACESASSPPKISSKIDFESDEAEDEPTTPKLKAIIDLTAGTTPVRSETNLGASSKQFTTIFKSRREFVRSPDVKKRKQDSNTVQDRTTVINNIHIVVNGNETETGDDCTDNVRNVSVSSRSDEDGNIITDVHLTIITDSKGSKVKVGDIPVIEGRGYNYEEPPQFHPVNPLKPVRPPVVRHRYNYIPQIQNNHRHQGDDRRWYNSVTYTRPQSRFYYDYEPRTWRPFPPVDDKIEPPLSRTASNNNH